MQPVFFDIPAGAFSRNSMLQEWVQDGYAVTGRLRRSGYDRVKLLAEQPAGISKKTGCICTSSSQLFYDNPKKI